VTFTSNSGPAYTNLARCSWLITAASGKLIRIVFSSFATEDAYDVVTVRDGGSTSSTVLWSDSGRKAPGLEIYTNGNAALVTFESDSSVVLAGFTATAYAIDRMNAPTSTPRPTPSSSPTPTSTPWNCSGLHQIAATLYGAQFPFNAALYGSTYTYANRLSCSWLITVPAPDNIRITFQEFDTEANHDNVTVYEGSEPLQDNVLYQNSGSSQGQGTDYDEVVTSTNVALVTFVSDASVTASGFLVTAFNAGCRYRTLITATTGGTRFYANTGIRFYGYNLFCSWIISAPADQAIRIVFTEFDTALYGQYVTVYDTSWENPSQQLYEKTGNGTMDEVQTTQNSACITFTSRVLQSMMMNYRFVAVAYAVPVPPIPTPS